MKDSGGGTYFSTSRRMSLFENVKIKPEKKIICVRKRTKSIKIIMFVHMYGLSLYFVNRTDRSSVFCLLGYPLNPGLAVSTDPNNSVHVHQKYLVPN